MPVQPPTDCSPSAQLAEIPCLRCLSTSELQEVLLLAWAEANGFTLPEDLDTILELSKCNTCTSETQRLRMEVTAISEAVLEEGNPASIAEAVKCLPGLKPGQVQAAISYLKCRFWANYTPA